MARTYEEAAAILHELSTLTPARSNDELLDEWCRKAPPRSAEYPEGVNMLAMTTFAHARRSLRSFRDHLAEACGGKHFVHVTPDDCDSWLAEREARLAGRELRTYRSTQGEAQDIKRFYEWLRARKKLLPQGNPWTDPLSDFTRRHRHDVVPEMRALQVWETTNIMASAGPREFIGTLTGVKLMARLGELMKIADTDVFLKERFIAIREHPKRKGPQVQGLPKKLRDKVSDGYFMFPIDEELGRALDWWYAEGKWEFSDHPYLIPCSTGGRPDKPMANVSWWFAFRQVVERSDVVVSDWNDPEEAVMPHTLRRTGSSEMEKGSEGRFPIMLDSLRGDSLKTRGGSKGVYLKYREEDFRPFYNSSMPSFDADKVLRDLHRRGTIEAEVQALGAPVLARRIS